MPQRFWDLYRTEDIALPKHQLPPQDMPGMAYMAQSFRDTNTGDVWPSNISHPLPDHVTRAARHAYYASVSFLDEQIGRVLSELEELDLVDETVVVLHGDHGAYIHGHWEMRANNDDGDYDDYNDNLAHGKILFYTDIYMCVRSVCCCALCVLGFHLGEHNSWHKVEHARLLAC